MGARSPPSGPLPGGAAAELDQVMSGCSPDGVRVAPGVLGERVNRLPAPEAGGRVPPGKAGPLTGENPVDHSTVTLPAPAPPVIRRHVRLQPSPLLIRKISPPHVPRNGFPEGASHDPSDSPWAGWPPGHWAAASPEYTQVASSPRVGRRDGRAIGPRQPAAGREGLSGRSNHSACRTSLVSPTEAALLSRTESAFPVLEPRSGGCGRRRACRSFRMGRCRSRAGCAPEADRHDRRVHAVPMTQCATRRGFQGDGLQCPAAARAAGSGAGRRPRRRGPAESGSATTDGAPGHAGRVTTGRQARSRPGATP